MSNPTKAIGSIARRRGGDDWNLTPSAADDLVTAQIRIVGDLKPKPTTSKEPPAAEEAAPAEESAGGKDGSADMNGAAKQQAAVDSNA
jgi:hypothetical protein